MKLLLALGFLVFAATSAAAHPPIDPSPTVAERAAALAPGQFIWDTKSAPAGPLFLVIDLTAQRALLYSNGVPIAASTVSTGSVGQETPTGVFTILEKKVMHRSITYDNAPMPYMQRLTSKGVAIHAGDLPGYAASRGCIRFPAEFAKKLYAVTEIGTPVMIIDQAEIAERAQRAAEFERANDEYVRAKTEQQTAANRAVMEFERAKAAHEEMLRQHDAEMARYRSKVAPR